MFFLEEGVTNEKDNDDCIGSLPEYLWTGRSC